MNSQNDQADNERTTSPGDYLWDKSGEPDPEVQKLESVLARFQHYCATPVFADIVPSKRWRIFPLQMRMLPAFATVAVALAICVGAFLFYSRNTNAGATRGWSVARVAGTPKVGRKTVSERAASPLRVGQVLETDNQSRATLQDDATGQIQVDPSTRVRLLDTRSGVRRIALDHGTIHAYIWAAPGQFVVDTPSAMAVDLGCAYTLHVDDAGDGIVRTSLGWVGFKLNGREAFIPAGAACSTKAKMGPGTPYFEDASPEFRAALERFDFQDSAPEQRSNDLAIVLAQARKHDALTLWHLLARVDDSQRSLVYDRLVTLAPPPSTVTKDGIMHLDQHMTDLWWNELGFDEISVWRYWERNWSGASAAEAQK